MTEHAARLRLTLNGEAREAQIDTRLLLVEALREAFGATGTHIGCLTGDCGACTIELDGKIVKSCLILALQADGSEIVTIEGLAGPELTALQQAFWDMHGFQCGYCLPGQLFAARHLLTGTADPSHDEIIEALDGNLCRCTGYQFMIAAVSEAAARARGDASSAPAGTPGSPA